VPGLVASYDIRPGDGVGLFYAPEPTRGFTSTKLLKSLNVATDCIVNAKFIDKTIYSCNKTITGQLNHC